MVNNVNYFSDVPVCVWGLSVGFATQRALKHYGSIQSCCECYNQHLILLCA